MIHIKRTNAQNRDFIELVKDLDQELAIMDGDDHDFYAQYNTLDYIKHTMVAYHNDIPVACGAIRAYEHDAAEIKRMFTHTSARRKGIGRRVLQELEAWAQELGFMKCMLETGLQQPDAIRLYESMGYTRIPNYGPYQGIDNSQCFEKILPL